MATTKTAKPPVDNINTLFHDAMKSYEEALKSGITMQEEAVKLWKDLLAKLGTPEDLQKKLEEMSSSVFPAAQKRMEEVLAEFKRCSDQSMELIEKAIAIPQATSIPESQEKMQQLMESSLGALRTNVQSVLNTNAKIMSSWQDMVDKAVAMK